MVQIIEVWPQNLLVKTTISTSRLLHFMASKNFTDEIVLHYFFKSSQLRRNIELWVAKGDRRRPKSKLNNLNNIIISSFMDGHEASFEICATFVATGLWENDLLTSLLHVVASFHDAENQTDHDIGGSQRNWLWFLQLYCCKGKKFAWLLVRPQID